MNFWFWKDLMMKTHECGIHITRWKQCNSCKMSCVVEKAFFQWHDVPWGTTRARCNYRYFFLERTVYATAACWYCGVFNERRPQPNGHNCWPLWSCKFRLVNCGLIRKLERRTQCKHRAILKADCDLRVETMTRITCIYANNEILMNKHERSWWVEKSSKKRSSVPTLFHPTY